MPPGPPGLMKSAGASLAPEAVDGEGEGDLVTVGVVPVQGRFEERALVLVRVGAVDASVAVEGALRALAPRDALVVVRLDVSALDIDGRRRGHGGFGGRGVS